MRSGCANPAPSRAEHAAELEHAHARRLAVEVGRAASRAGRAAACVRITSRCAAIGFSTRDRRAPPGRARARRRRTTKLNVTISCQSRATSAALDAHARRALLRRAAASCCTCAARRRRNRVVAVDARDLLDEVLLDREVEAVRRRRHDEVVAVARRTRSRRRAKMSRDRVGVDGDAEEPRDARGAHAHRRRAPAARP